MTNLYWATNPGKGWRFIEIRLYKFQSGSSLVEFIFNFDRLFLSLSFPQIIIMANIIQWNGVSYNKKPYPGWAEFIGWVMALSSMSLIPGFAIYQLWKTPGSIKEVMKF